MAALRPMPYLAIAATSLQAWGEIWLGTKVTTLAKVLKKARRRVGKSRTRGKAKAKLPNRFTKKQSMEFGRTFDSAFGDALAVMLGGIPVETPKARSLLPAAADCVEVGTTRIVGGIRPQNFDAAYRPDGPRVVFDSKTLNDTKSIAKNWQNMVNDLATEASTVHTRFPMCVVAFIVAIPRRGLEAPQERDIVRTLERLGTRLTELDQPHLAEAIALIVWNPSDGSIDETTPPAGSPLRIEKFSESVSKAYEARYKNLPPHQESDPDETGEEYLNVASEAD